VVTTGSSTLVCNVKQTNGTYPDIEIDSDVTIDTDTGKDSSGNSIPGWQSDSKQFHVGNVWLKPGVTVTVTGKAPLVVMANGSVRLDGAIVARGGDADPLVKTLYDYTGTGYGGWYHYDEYRTSYSSSYQHSQPGSGGSGGGDGGKRGTLRTYTNSYGWYHRPTKSLGNDGKGWGGGSKGGGTAGSHSKPYSYSYSTYGYDYYYYSGPGGGGASVEAGSNGQVLLNYNGYQGTPGKGGTDKVPLTSLDPDEVVGGGGGGGGSLGGYHYWNKNYGYSYYYPRGGGCAGGGGGGAVGICAKGTIHLGGLVDVRGGSGGSYVSTYYYYCMDGSGGGGGGGNVRLHSQTGFTFGSPEFDCSGGLGGRTESTYSSYQWVSTRGGAGGKGGLHVTAPTTPTLPEVNPELPSGLLILGDGGKFKWGFISVRDTAVSTWMTTGTLLPEYHANTMGSSGNGLKDLLIQGALVDPATGDADPDTATDWVDAFDATDVTKLKGYMFFRFKVVLEAPLPKVDSVTIGYKYPVP
jgi:hypothetical protein